MFNNIPHRYDALNTIISLGLDRRWRRRRALAMFAAATRRSVERSVNATCSKLRTPNEAVAAPESQVGRWPQGESWTR